NIRNIAGVGVTDSGTSRQSSMQITVNGMQSETSTVRKYIFIPEHDMTIPSYTVRIGGDNYKTKPIKIKVVTSNAPALQKSEKFSFSLKSEKHSVNVGESFVMTVYLSLSKNLQGVQISDYVAPSSPDFFIKEVEGQKKYEHNGYTIVEMRYIVTPKKEGNFTISGAQAKLGQADWSRQDIFGRPATSWRVIATNGLQVEVKAAPANSDLIGDFHIEAKLDKQSVKSNKPVNLTIKIEGKGSLEDFEFPKYDIDDVTVYSDEAKVESHIDGSTLRSSYVKSFAFIGSDDFVIPARNISVYNPNTNETKDLEIPSYAIHIEGKKTAAMPVVTSSPSIAPKVKTNVVEKTIQVQSVNWWMLAVAFILGMLALYLLQFLIKQWQGKDRNYKESDALKILYSHISEDKAVEEMVRKLYAKKQGDKSVQIDKKELKALIERFR
ncbi:MAG TPA: hypothetical protein ENK39_02340, partial [Epsilonproteobacteria bacterium]|nr:hypothetical protein [Campylobacterota bacterium]